MRMHPLALAESGWVWVGAGSRPAGLRTGRAIPGLRRDAALPVRQNTCQGREGGALPKPFSKIQQSRNDAALTRIGVTRAHEQIKYAREGKVRSSAGYPMCRPAK